MLRLNVIIIFVFFVFCSCSEEVKEKTYLLAPKWTSLNDSKYQLWFQDWSEFTRLLLLISEDTLKYDPSPYATRTKNKPYLYPKSFVQIQKKQLAGNIYWHNNPDWSNNFENDFTWEVDRANPNSKLPLVFSGTAKIKDDLLYFILKTGSDVMYDLSLKQLDID